MEARYKVPLLFRISEPNLFVSILAPVVAANGSILPYDRAAALQGTTGGGCLPPHWRE